MYSFRSFKQESGVCLFTGKNLISVYCLLKVINYGNRKNILNLLKEKSSTKQKVYQITKNVFSEYSRNFNE